MKPTDYSSLSTAVVDRADAMENVVQESSRVADASAVDVANEVKADADIQGMGIACMDLLANLESHLSKSRRLDKDDFLDESSGMGGKMLDLLGQFTQQWLVGDAAERSKSEIDRARTVTYAFAEVLKTRSLTQTLVRVFWNVEESQEIVASHAQLGEALVRSCAATFCQTATTIGVETEFGQEVIEGTATFVNELEQLWSQWEMDSYQPALSGDGSE